MKRFFLVALFSVAMFGRSYAQTATPGYAVVSLIGDQVSVVVYTGQTGTSMQPTRKLVEPAKGTAFDDAAVSAAGAAIQQVQPGTTPQLLSTGNRDLYQAQDKLLDSGNEAARAALQAALKDMPVDYVIVLTKYQTDARFALPMQNKFGGDGKVGGIGYYVDDKKRVQTLTDGSGKGFLATFAYVKALLIDAKNFSLIREQVSLKSELTVNSARIVNSWDLLTAEQKSDALQNVIRAAAQDSVGKLLAK